MLGVILPIFKMRRSDAHFNRVQITSIDDDDFDFRTPKRRLSATDIFQHVFGTYGALTGSILTILAALVAWIGIQDQVFEQKMANVVADKAAVDAESERLAKVQDGLLSVNRLVMKVEKVENIYDRTRLSENFPYLHAFARVREVYKNGGRPFLGDDDPDIKNIREKVSSYDVMLLLAYLEDVKVLLDACNVECNKPGESMDQIEIDIGELVAQINELDDGLEKHFHQIQRDIAYNTERRNIDGETFGLPHDEGISQNYRDKQVEFDTYLNKQEVHVSVDEDGELVAKAKTQFPEARTSALTDFHIDPSLLSHEPSLPVPTPYLRHKEITKQKQ